MTTENEEVRQLLKSVEFGIEVEAFLRTPIGQYLARRAEEERAAALEELATVSPINVEAIRKLQNVIARADAFGYWLAEAVSEGQNAIRVIEEVHD